MQSVKSNKHHESFPDSKIRNDDFNRIREVLNQMYLKSAAKYMSCKDA